MHGGVDSFSLAEGAGGMRQVFLVEGRVKRAAGSPTMVKARLGDFVKVIMYIQITQHVNSIRIHIILLLLFCCRCSCCCYFHYCSYNNNDNNNNNYNNNNNNNNNNNTINNNKNIIIITIIIICLFAQWVKRYMHANKQSFKTVFKKLILN